MTKNSILLVEYANQLKARGRSALEAMQEAGRIRLRPIVMTSVATITSAIPVALGLGAGSTSRRPLGYVIIGGVLFSTLLSLFLVPVVYVILDSLRGTSRVRAEVPQAAADRIAGGGRVILTLLAALQVAAGPVLVADTIPALTLAEALQRGTGLNPDYVNALGRVGEAEWGRRNAMLAFVIPSVNLTMDWTNYSTAFFNIGTGKAQQNQVQGTLNASYEIISVRKITELGRTRADLEAADANEVQQRFRAALLIESTFYEVLAEARLLQVADDRARRAEEQLAVARARVLSGATVQTDSLQLLLEFTKAQVEQLRTRALLDVARLELGRRTGSDGPVDAVPLGTPVPEQLPLTLDQAVADALATGPDWMIARAQAHAAERRLQGLRGQYLPRVDLNYNRLQFDDHFYPSAFGVSALNLRVSWSLWDLGRRELSIAQATTERNVADAVSADLMRAARHDVAQAYEAFETARAALDLQMTSVVVAQETFRVQQERYKSGAATILDLLDAQVNLTQAQSDLVQAAFVARLAWAGLEAILGQRLTPSN